MSLTLIFLPSEQKQKGCREDRQEHDKDFSEGRHARAFGRQVLRSEGQGESRQNPKKSSHGRHDSHQFLSSGPHLRSRLPHEVCGRPQKRPQGSCEASSHRKVLGKVKYHLI